jgi:hypothetical protein
MDRAAYLLSILKALRTLYPQDPEIAYGWVKMRNRQFDNLTSLEMMKKDGLICLAKIDWHLSARLEARRCGAGAGVRNASLILSTVYKYKCFDQIYSLGPHTAKPKNLYRTNTY